MKWSELKHDPCPVARGLSVIGDRWTMLIIRECFRGVRRFDDFQRGLGITRHVLSDRLRKLEEDGVLTRVQYQDRPARWEYRLTDAGRALHQVMLSMVGWAQEWGPPRPEGPGFRVTDRDTGRPVRPLMVDAETGEPLDPRRLSIEFG